MERQNDAEAFLDRSEQANPLEWMLRSNEGQLRQRKYGIRRQKRIMRDVEKQNDWLASMASVVLGLLHNNRTQLVGNLTTGDFVARLLKPAIYLLQYPK